MYVQFLNGGRNASYHHPLEKARSAIGRRAQDLYESYMCPIGLISSVYTFSKDCHTSKIFGMDVRPSVCSRLSKTLMLSMVGPRNHVLDGVHIGDTWRMRVICPCAAAMWPYVILL